MIALQAGEPSECLGPVQLWLRHLGERHIEVGMQVSDVLCLPAAVEVLQSILADGLQHAEAGLASQTLLLSQEALVNQRRQSLEDVDRRFAPPADRLGRFQRATTREDGESPEQGLLAGVQKR